jgi:hypothetical protein
MAAVVLGPVGVMMGCVVVDVPDGALGRGFVGGLALAAGGAEWGAALAGGSATGTRSLARVTPDGSAPAAISTRPNAVASTTSGPFRTRTILAAPPVEVEHGPGLVREGPSLAAGGSRIPWRPTEERPATVQAYLPPTCQPRPPG